MYCHARDWDAALRVAEAHDKDAAAEVLCAQVGGARLRRGRVVPHDRTACPHVNWFGAANTQGFWAVALEMKMAERSEIGA